MDLFIFWFSLSVSYHGNRIVSPTAIRLTGYFILRNSSRGAGVRAGLSQCVHLQLNTNARFAGDVVLRDMEVGDTGTTTGAAGWTVDRVVHKARYGRNCGSDLDEAFPLRKITATRISDTEWHLTASSALYCVGGSLVSSDARVDFNVILEVN